MGKGKMISAAVAAAALVATPFVAKWEGKKNDPYYDIAGVKTVCYGETRVKMKRYTDKECTDMLMKAVESFTADTARLTPTIVDKPEVLASVSSLTYNIGVGAYSGSTARRRFLAGDFKGGCDAILMWNKARVNGKLQVSRGLQNRRREEHQLCLSGLQSS